MNEENKKVIRAILLKNKIKHFIIFIGLISVFFVGFNYFLAQKSKPYLLLKGTLISKTYIINRLSPANYECNVKLETNEIVTALCSTKHAKFNNVKVLKGDAKFQGYNYTVLDYE